FVAHGSHGVDLIVLTAVIALLFPAAIAAVEAAAGWIGARARTAFHLCAVTLLVMAIFLPLTHRRWGLPDGAAIGAALLGAIVVAAAYARFGAVRLFATGLSPGVIAIPLLFLASGTIRSLIVPGSPPAPVAVHVGSPAPVVIVVF